MNDKNPKPGNDTALPDDAEFTIEELEACDYTEVRMGPRGIEHYSGKHGHKLKEPLGTPAEQIRAMRQAKRMQKGAGQ